MRSPGPLRVEAPCEHYPACGGCRFQDLEYGAQLAQKHAQVRDAFQRIAGIAEPPLEPIVPCEPEIFHYRNKMEYSFAPTPDGLVLGLHRAGRWDEVLDIRKCWLTTDFGNEIRDAVRSWASEEGLAGVLAGGQHAATSGTSSCAKGATPGQALVQLVTAPGEQFERGYLDRRSARVPAGALVHWSINDRPAEVTNLPSELLWGDGCDRGGARRPALPRAAECVPADEHVDGREAVRARARGGAADRHRDRLGPLLRDRHDRALARGATR